ncbi:hypothetical protein M8J76_004966 [Diaphorina citri]|nr:hypothetical protein M8J75_015895 [Diaphorina citri]KAI5749145.1 hypothetical protein M8J76_004966 [Diaphorina citri]
MVRERDRSRSDYSYDKESKRRKRHSPAYKSFSSNERSNRTRRHACGSSAERRFKRSHRRSPLSDEYSKVGNNHSSRGGGHHEREREREKHRSDHHHHRRKSPHRHRSDRVERKRDRRSYSSSQIDRFSEYFGNRRFFSSRKIFVGKVVICVWNGITSKHAL